jgi:hypothetical protein
LLFQRLLQKGEVEMIRKFGVLLAALTMVVALGACAVEKTEEGEMPEVNIEGGNLPEYDVDPVDVDISTSTETATITVPDVDVDVNPPDNTRTDPNRPPQ